jgi:hypothetical protein
LSQPDMERKRFLLRPARIFPHSRFTTYCRTFQLSTETDCKVMPREMATCKSNSFDICAHALCRPVIIRFPASPSSVTTKRRGPFRCSPTMSIFSPEVPTAENRQSSVSSLHCGSFWTT